MTPMYVPPLFRTPDPQVWSFVESRSFGTLIAMDLTGAPRPLVANVPFIVNRAGGSPRLECHVARANPIHAAIAQNPSVTLLVDGADAYVSPDWYVSEDQVPTWNYQRAELRGEARLLPDTEYRAHVDRLSSHFETQLLPKPVWSTTKMTAARLAAMLKAIVCVEITVAEVAGSLKLGQTKTPADRSQVAAALRRRGRANDVVIADLIEETLAAKTMGER
jgi:transcriptional regulator